MPRFLRALFAFAVLALLGAAPPALAAPEPLGLFLTWRTDPTTTMVIDWHTATTDVPGTLQHRPLAAADASAAPWSETVAATLGFPFAERTIHRVELTGLAPATTYEFRCEPDGRIYRFRTMPAHAMAPITVALGGDTRHNKAWMDAVNRQAMRYDPEFIVWGGDLAYADGLEEKLQNWIEWFDSVRETLVAPDGRVVPIVVGIGNHEVRGGYIWGGGRGDDGYEQTDEFRASIAPYFYALFAFPGQPGYGVLDFGDYLSLVILDTDHSNPIPGAQTEWLRRTLAARAGRVPHILPVVHVPGYPSHRSFEGRVSRRVREHFVPLFEAYGVRFVFENHDHTYKRTLPLRGDRPDRDGIVYFGDGAWGVRTREVRPVEEYGYMARVESVRHAIIMTLEGPHASFEVIAEDGRIIDRFPALPAPGPLPDSGK